MKRNSFLLLLAGSFIGLMVCFGPHSASAIDSQAQGSKPEIKIDSKTFDPYVGQYVFSESPDFVLSFFREGDRFYVQATDQGRIEIFPASETKFFPKIIDADVTFIRDSNGKVVSLVWRQNSRETPYRKSSNQPAVEKNVPLDKREEMIRMRDGVRLHTLIFTLKTTNQSMPILMERTPYGVGEYDSDAINRSFREFIPDGYIFV